MSQPRDNRLGRLALRTQGDWWVAYYASPNTMQGAVELGRVRLRFVADPMRKNAFIDLMREAVSDVIEESIGLRPKWPTEPEQAPESERESRNG